MAINLNFRRQLHLARFESLPEHRREVPGEVAHGEADDAGADLIEVLTHCLICGRPLPWFSRVLGGTLCRRRECHLEYDQRQP